MDLSSRHSQFQGFEQPSESSLNLKLFLQGYYINGGSMQPVLINQGIAASPNETDTIEIALYHATSFELLDSRKAVLLTDGTVSANFTQPEGTYYVVIKHRNSIQAWSADPVNCRGSGTLYDFSTSSSDDDGPNPGEAPLPGPSCRSAWRPKSEAPVQVT